VELLRWRVAARLGFHSVDAWYDATTPDDRANMMAVAWLDGWGEEYQQIAAEIHNASLRAANASGAKYTNDDAKGPEDMRRCQHIERDTKPVVTRDQWAAFGKALCPWGTF
jgi:hypothetical protein